MYYDYYYVTCAPNSTGRKLFIQYFIIYSPLHLRLSLSHSLYSAARKKPRQIIICDRRNYSYALTERALQNTHTPHRFGCRHRRPLGYYMNFDLSPFFFSPSVRLFYDPDTFKPDENTTPFGLYGVRGSVIILRCARSRVLVNLNCKTAFQNLFTGQQKQK